MTDEQKVVAGIYKQLSGSPAWKDLMRVAEQEILRSRDHQDAIPAKDLNTNTVCEERGYRNGIRWLLKQVQTKSEIG